MIKGWLVWINRTDLDIKTHWKMKARSAIGIFQKMRIKNLREEVRSDLKKLDLFTLETSKNHLVRNFLRNERVRVKTIGCLMET